MIQANVMRKKPLKKTAVKKIAVYTALVALAITFLFPYLWLISSSLKEPTAIFSVTGIRLIPTSADGGVSFAFENYRNAFLELRFEKVFLNTLIVCVVNTFVNLLLNSLAGYAFARIRFKGSELIFKIILTSMMVPGAVMLIPNFLIINNLGIYNTLLALILPFIMSVYNVFLLRQQFYAVSRELEEAAQIDGAGRLRLFFTIALPLVTPMLVVLGITTFMWNYNNYMWPLVAVEPQGSAMTLAVSLGSLVSAGNADVNKFPVMLAGAVIVSAPLIVVFFVLQKYIIAGIQVGSVKG